MKRYTLLEKISLVVLVSWCFTIIPVIVFPNLKSMAIVMGETLATVTLYYFGIGWMLPFILFIKKNS